MQAKLVTTWIPLLLLAAGPGVAGADDGLGHGVGWTLATQMAAVTQSPYLAAGNDCAPTPASAAAGPAGPAAAPAPQRWELRPDDRTLRFALSRWAVSAGWQLQWDAPIDYAVETSSVTSGSFQQAVEAVTRGMEGAELPLKAIFYKGNSVLRIVGKGGL